MLLLSVKISRRSWWVGCSRSRARFSLEGRKETTAEVRGKVRYSTKMKSVAVDFMSNTRTQSVDSQCNEVSHAALLVETASLLCNERPVTVSNNRFNSILGCGCGIGHPYQ